MHYPSHIDLGVYIGTIGLFFVFFLLFARYFPVLALNEVKTILKSSGEYYKNLPDDHGHHEAEVVVEVKEEVEVVVEEETATEEEESAAEEDNNDDEPKSEDNDSSDENDTTKE